MIANKQTKKNTLEVIKMGGIMLNGMRQQQQQHHHHQKYMRKKINLGSVQFKW